MFFSARISSDVIIRERASVMIEYESARVVPMTAPVARFSLRMPVAPVAIIMIDVIDAAMLIPSSIPIIML